MRKVPVAQDVDAMTLARGTPGYSVQIYHFSQLSSLFCFARQLLPHMPAVGNGSYSLTIVPAQQLDPGVISLDPVFLAPLVLTLQFTFMPSLPLNHPFW